MSGAVTLVSASPSARRARRGFSTRMEQRGVSGVRKQGTQRRSPALRPSWGELRALIGVAV